jgi:hypothetical protein
MTRNWRKLGLVFNARDLVPEWAQDSALTPTPLLHADGHIRVYAGFRDRAGISRIGYVDVAAEDPRRVLRVSRRPALDIGRDGCFDDNGVILGDVVRVGSQLFLFYVGFQLVAKAKFLALSGLAVSEDEGETFQRVSEAPFLGRAQGQTTIAAIHTAWHDDAGWRFWYAAGDGWEHIAGKPYPRYEIRHLQRDSLLPSVEQGELCIAPTPPEYRIGRPRVYSVASGYLMHFTKGTVGGDYTPGRALSDDGIHWQRDPSSFDICLSPKGWDSRHLCYPVMIDAGGKRYMFYSGNDMGIDGFGCAIMEAES